MKLCTICDKKITGTWCKNCHKFVKTYEIASGIRLNERHDPMNDKDCTYHTDMTGNAARERTDIGTRRTYTSTASSSSSGTGQPVTKKKGKKAILLVIIGYIFVNCIGFIVPGLVKMAENVSEGFRAENLDKEMPEETEYTEEELEELINKELRNTALQKLTPDHCAEEADYEIWYYNPADIDGLGYSCDNRHYNMNFEAFEKLLIENYSNSIQYVDRNSVYGNYFYISEEYSTVQFSGHREYDCSGEFLIRVDYDTATKKLHGVDVEVKNDGTELELCYALLKEIEPESEMTFEQFEQDVGTAKETGEYTTIYCLENTYVSYSVDEEGYSIRFRPAF